MSRNELPVVYENRGGIVSIRFNRPDVLNALDVDTAVHFLEACRRLSQEDALRVVVISGEGRAFVAGGDLLQMRMDPLGVAQKLIDPMHKAILLLSQLEVPVLCAAHGAVAGAGLSLAMACDLCVAAEGTKFNLAYVNVAASCDVSGSWHLARHVGLRRAMEIALLGKSFDAEEALRMGLVNQVVPAAELPHAIDELASRLAKGPTVAYGKLKKLLRASANETLSNQLDAERAEFLACAGTRDFIEALDAFAEKRAPQFVGC